MNKKIAFVKDGCDIARIIVGKPKGAKYDFKFSLMENDYAVCIVPFFKKPQLFDVDIPSHWEITYHKSQGNKSPIIAMKHKSIERPGKYPSVEQGYKTFPFKNLLEPTIVSEFPIPIFKIALPLNKTSSIYKPDIANHVLLDMQKNNIAEVYLTNTKFNFETFTHKWPNISLGLLVHSFEFYATNDIKYTVNKSKYFFPQGKDERIANISFPISDDVMITIILYNDANINTSIIKPQLTFIENEHYFGLLGHTTVAFPESDGKISAKRYAYELDLENSEYFTTKEKDKWYYWFNRWRVQLERAIKNSKR